MFDAKNFKNLTPSEKEEKILNFWQQNKTFEKSLLKKASRGSFVFLDTYPPFSVFKKIETLLSFYIKTV